MVFLWFLCLSIFHHGFDLKPQNSIGFSSPGDWPLTQGQIACLVGILPMVLKSPMVPWPGCINDIMDYLAMNGYSQYICIYIFSIYIYIYYGLFGQFVPRNGCIISGYFMDNSWIITWWVKDFQLT